MNSYNLEKLEYNKILDKLSMYCCSYIGKQYIGNLTPSFVKREVETLLKETSESLSFITKKGAIPIAEISDISLSLKKLESNVSLSAKSLLEIAFILKISRELKDFFYSDKDFDISIFPILDSYFSSLYSNLEIEKLIFSSILDENTIADSASSKLLSLRKNRKKLESDIKDVLNNILHSSNYAKAIMESIITIRNERYVIPIKEEFRGFIKGFIHDVSSSGSTIFLEPMQVFEINNKIQSIKMEEKLEIEHILEQLSNKLYPYISEISNDIYIIGKLDFIFAKAKFSKDINGVCPILNDNKIIDLKRARHPLIENDKVVPIDIKIGENYSSLIITGPNTGGKTVTLKTTGLLTLMACSGLFIPVKENSSIYVFDNIFADIGDEQSIQESLSTFSSHMTNIVNIIKQATSNSLILIDELGSGTDPVEGANLAISILEYFHKLGCLTLITTHYQEIKNYALIADGFENASSDFDVENLKPTYQLLIGVPGKSNAFSISKKLGLPDEILDRAKSLLKDSDVNVEELLKNIYDNKLIIENDKIEIEKNLNQVESLRKLLEQEKTKLHEQNETNIEKAKSDAKNILISAKEDANSIIKDLNLLYGNLKQFENINFNDWDDSQIANFVKQHFQKGTLKEANKLRNNLSSYYGNLSDIEDSNLKISVNQYKKENLNIGMKVKLSNFSEVAVITSLSGKKNQLQVLIGNAKMNVNINDIENIINVKDTSNIINSKTSSNYFKSKEITPEINVIGQNIEEACFVIDKYLDDCAISNFSPIRIVHGKGTGKLREGIHTFLKKHPHVKSFRLGTFGEGEMGVTIVELK